MKTWKCRECGNDVGRSSHVRLGTTYMPPTQYGTSHALCVACIDKMMGRLRTPTPSEFFPAYRRYANATNGRAPSVNTQLRDQLAKQEERMLQLEQMLESLTAPARSSEAR